MDKYKYYIVKAKEPSETHLIGDLLPEHIELDLVDIQLILDSKYPKAHGNSHYELRESYAACEFAYIILKEKLLKLIGAKK